MLQFIIIFFLERFSCKRGLYRYRFVYVSSERDRKVRGRRIWAEKLITVIIEVAIVVTK